MSAKKRAEEPDKEENLERWLLTYSDLITLLMLFFIVMYAMSSTSKTKFEEIIESLRIGFTTGYTLIKNQYADTNRTSYVGIKKGESNINETSFTRSQRRIFLSSTYKNAIHMFDQEIKNSRVKVDITERGIIISLSSDIYFHKASAELDIENSINIFEKLADFFTKEKGNYSSIRVEGYTDNTPTDPNGPWRTNWDLASARAITVLNYLIDYGVDPTKLSSASYGEYKPIFDNDSEEHRSFNRRVDIAILRDE